MRYYRSIPARFIVVAILLVLGTALVRAGQVWENWSRLYLTKDMSTEWLVANDKDWNGMLSPQQTMIYVLVPPTVTRVGRHWEITFDSTGQKKKQLAEHFDNTGVEHPHAPDFHGAARNGIHFPLFGKDISRPFCPWLTISSKAFWAGHRDPLTVDSLGSGYPDAYNLDPDDALGIAFLEPTVTEKDGEWLITTTANPTDRELGYIVDDYADWTRHHPGPHGGKIEKEVYPPKLQQEFDAFWAALKKWQADGAQGLSPRYENYFLVTADQQKQYTAWRKAVSDWMQTDGTTPYPQPIDYMKDDDSGPKKPVFP
jgi:hypothetical protein